MLLEVESQDALQQLAQKAKEDGVPVSSFLEPDLGDELTAIALGPSGRQLVRRLPLAFTL